MDGRAVVIGHVCFQGGFCGLEVDARQVDGLYEERECRMLRGLAMEAVEGSRCRSNTQSEMIVKDGLKPLRT